MMVAPFLSTTLDTACLLAVIIFVVVSMCCTVILSDSSSHSISRSLFEGGGGGGGGGHVEFLGDDVAYYYTGSIGKVYSVVGYDASVGFYFFHAYCLMLLC